MSMYNMRQLTEYLSIQKEEEVVLGLNDIAEIIGPVPEAAKEQRWWWNIKSSSRAQAWLSAGYKTQDLETLTQNSTIKFVRTGDSDLKKENSLARQMFYFLFDEEHPTRKRLMALLALVMAVLGIIAAAPSAVDVGMKVVEAVQSHTRNQDTGRVEAYYEALVKPNPNFDVAVKYLKNGDYNKAHTYFNLALEECTEADAAKSDIAKIQYNIGYVCFTISRFEDAIHAYLNCETIAEKLADDNSADYNPEDLFPLYINLAKAFLYAPSYPNALGAANRYIGKAQRQFDEEEYIRFNQVSTEITFAYLDDTPLLELEFDDNDALSDTDFQHFQDYLDIQIIMAALSRRTQEPVAAYAYYCKALAGYEYLQLRGEDGLLPMIGTLHDNVAVCALDVGRTDEGVKHNQKAVEILMEINGSLNYDTAQAIMNLGYSYFHAEDYEEAYKCDKKALEIFDELGIKNDSVATLYNNTALCLSRMGRHEESIENYMMSISLYDALGIKSIYTVETYLNYAIELMTNNDNAGGREWADKAYDLVRLVADEDSSLYSSVEEFRDFMHRKG